MVQRAVVHVLLFCVVPLAKLCPLPQPQVGLPSCWSCPSALQALRGEGDNVAPELLGQAFHLRGLPAPGALLSLVLEHRHCCPGKCCQILHTGLEGPARKEFCVFYSCKPQAKKYCLSKWWNWQIFCISFRQSLNTGESSTYGVWLLISVALLF